MTTDPTPLQESIARELYARGNDELRKAWDNPRNLHQVPQWREKYRELSAAVLPIIAAEVRKAQADALRQSARAIHASTSAGEIVMHLHNRAAQIEKEN